MESLLVFVIVLAIAAVIAGVSYGIYRWTHPKLKEQRDDSNDLQESLDRVLQPIEDEDLSKQVQNYKDEEDD